LLPRVVATVAYARWRDVIFVHAGLPAGATLGTLVSDDRQLWDPDRTFVSGAGVAIEPGLSAFRDAGVHRVVVGHVPQDRGPTIDHDGTLLLLDTNASAMRSPSGGPMTAFATLARIEAVDSFDEPELVMVDTSGAPDRSP